ncbi:Sec23/Sec24 trunk domain-containing protein [Mucor mucedo]|uniref:Sec23/Sec24 trunk domain-containing protein n=1 Tax=Mucor mucedo TaxID=29922 RepID=UPI002220B800|nr:Sec23/Sec24 trunk domain-containing protein [Mucor mucedo]KAI7891079.1 Sec23/Sec24 trunk domain-containing protein [Mucor mucedo]
MQLCNNKKAKRLYPDLANKRLSPTLVNSVSILHNPHQHQRQQPLENTFSTMALDQPFKYDVPLIGTAPPVHDFNQPIPTPSIPASASVTSSLYSQCDAMFQRCTLNSLPSSAYLLKRSKLPLSIMLEPYPRNQLENVEVPLITTGVVSRCTRCKSFINPFIQFIEGGLKWKCNICTYSDNNVPPAYDWDHVTQQKSDRWSRSELNYGCVDYVATPEFMSRPPQPPVYVFVIDTSLEAVQTGMIEVLAEALMGSLDRLPNAEGRTRIAFITVNHAIGFYALRNKEPELIVMSEIDDVYLPRAHHDLVVNLNEARSVVLDLLDRLKTMFTVNPHTYATTRNNNCLGPALKAARQLLTPTGGKIVCFQASLPNMGIGALTAPTKKGHGLGDNLLLEPKSDFYRSFSEECAKYHVCTDMFVFGSQNIDLATLNVVPRFTGGQTHYYPGFNAHNKGDREKLFFEIKKLVKEEIGLEAILRTRCSPGLICKSYHGNFSFQEPDIFVLPNVPRDASYCVDLAIERELQGDLAYIQTCMLFTTSFGERCIRVMTTCIPITRKITDVFYAADQIACARSLAYQAIDKAVTFKVRDGKEYLIQKTVAVCSAYSKEIIGVTPSKNIQLNLCRSLSLLPAMTLALIKSEAFNDTGVVPLNMSNQSGLLLRTLPLSLWPRYVYPNLYSLHNMPVQAGTLDRNNHCIMPPQLNLSSERLDRHGCYLVENGHRILIWIGREAVPQLCEDLLNVSRVQDVRSGQVASLPELQNAFSERVHRIISKLRTESRHSNFYPSLYVVKEEGDVMLRHWFLTHMLEDRQQPPQGCSPSIHKSINATTSYFQWLNYIKDKM